MFLRNLAAIFLIIQFCQLSAQNNYELIRDFNYDASELIQINENESIVINNNSDGAFYRLNFSKGTHLYFYLENGDSATFWYDSISNQLLYSTTFPEIFEFVELTSGQGELEHIMITYQADEISEKIRLSDSIVNAMLNRHAYLKNKYQSLISDTFWDAQEMNIICHPLSSLIYFADDSLILEYMGNVLERVRNIPQSTHAKIVNGSLSCKTPEYIEWKYTEEIKTPEGYHRVLLKYFKPDVAEIMVLKKLIKDIEIHSENVEEVNRRADEALAFIESKKGKEKLEQTRQEVNRKIEQLNRLGFALFSDVVTLDGEKLTDISSGQKPKYLMVTSSGCAPCIQASRWIKEHYEVIRERMEIYSVVVGRNERFKEEQEKDPYPWPVFYDEMSVVQQQLPKPAVPQYFVIKEGRLVELYAPRPQEYFSNVVSEE